MNCDGPRHLKLWLKRLQSPAFVYIIRSGEAIKIGFAKDVTQRIIELQCGNPVELELLHVFPADIKLEGLLHRKLKHARLRGEWFAGEGVEEFLEYASELADAMLLAWNGTVAPDYEDFDEDFREKPVEMTVRFVEPDPLPEPPNPSDYDYANGNRAHPLARQRISRSQSSWNY